MRRPEHRPASAAATLSVFMMLSMAAACSATWPPAMAEANSPVAQGNGAPGKDEAICPDAVTTPDINECLGEIAARADQRMAEYVARARTKAASEPTLVSAIDSAQAAFITYREAECGAVYEDWKDGTIRGAMALGCRRDLADERTHWIWQTWLSYPDSTPPDLPEPLATR